MCFGGGSPPPRQEAPPPPPPPPMEDPASPAFNEDMTNSANADVAVRGARRGRKALRVDLNTTRAQSPSGAATGGSAIGLNIPT